MVNIDCLWDRFKEKDSKIYNCFFECLKIIFDRNNYESPIYKEWKNFFIYCYGSLNDKKDSANNKKYFENLSKIYQFNINNHNIYQFMYSLQTTYYLLLKLIFVANAEYEIEEFNKNDLESLLSGNLISNLTNQEYWYIDFDINIIEIEDDSFLKTIKKLYLNIKEYKVNNARMENVADKFTKMYELLFPKEIRHALGEYYTPSWLAQNTLNELEFKDKKIIDPTCGSGAFLECAVAKNSKNNIYGFDLNPIAVLTSKLVLSYYYGFQKFNIYENDILMYPDLIKKTNQSSTEFSIFIYGKEFQISENDKMKCINNDELYSSMDDVKLKEIYKNKLLQRIECIQLNNFDLVIGNPPWINWEYLPSVSKELTKKIWVDYNLFSQNGKELAFSKEDISLLVTYISIDKLLNNTGKLAFVLRTGSFKSKQNGIGFRNFKIGKNGTNIKVLKVNDFSNIKVFPGATNTACVAYFQKNRETVYPVPYFDFVKKNGKLCKEEVLAFPTTEEKNSLWLKTTKDKILISSKVLGQNSYKARTGIFTGGANAVYWIKIIGELSNGNILIENYTERAKRKAEKIQAEIEKDLVYQLCRGTDLGKNLKEDIYLICPHTANTKMNAIDFESMKRKYPKTLEYLTYFKDVLDDRKGFASWEKDNQLNHFYAIQRIGEYTFKPYKVAWKYISKSFDAFLISSEDNHYLGKKLILPSEKIIYVSFDDLDEANYIAGLLNSTVVKKTIEGFMTETSISTHVLDKILIYDFDSQNQLHKLISESYKNKNYEILNEAVRKYYDIPL